MTRGTKEFPILLDINDVSISDLRSNDLHENISDQFKVKYLSDSDQELDEVNGIMFGKASKLVGLLTMKIEENVKNIYFLVDTGFSGTFICEEVLNLYNLTIVNPNESVKVRLNKRLIEVYLSPIGSRYYDINCLGTDFLNIYDAQLLADFDERFFTIKFKDQTPDKTVVPTLQTSNLTVVPTLQTSDPTVVPTLQTSDQIVFASSIFIGLLVVTLVTLFVWRKRTMLFSGLQSLPEPKKPTSSNSNKPNKKQNRKRNRKHNTRRTRIYDYT